MKRWIPAIAGMGFVLSLACGGTPEEKTEPPGRTIVLHDVRGEVPSPDDDDDDQTPTTHGFAGPTTSGRGSMGPKLGECPPACIGAELPQ